MNRERAALFMQLFRRKLRVKDQSKHMLTTLAPPVIGQKLFLNLYCLAGWLNSC